MSTRRAAMSIERTASPTIGTSSSSPPSRSTSSTSTEGSSTIRRTVPTARSPSVTAQPSSSWAQYSPGSSAGASASATRRARPWSASAASRLSHPRTRTTGRSSVPARRTISPRSVGVPSASSRGRGPVTWKEPSRPWARPTRPASRKRSTRLLDDVEEDAPVVLDRGGLDHRAQRLRRAAAPADDAPVVLVVDGELEHERPVVLLELLDADLVGLVDERLREVLEQLPHGGLAGRGGLDALRLEQLAHGVGRLGAAVEPVAHALLVNLDRRRLRLRVVAADRLDEAAVAGRAAVGDDDAPHGILLPAHAGESHADGHGASRLAQPPRGAERQRRVGLELPEAQQRGDPLGAALGREHAEHVLQLAQVTRVDGQQR